MSDVLITQEITEFLRDRSLFKGQPNTAFVFLASCRMWVLFYSFPFVFEDMNVIIVFLCLLSGKGC